MKTLHHQTHTLAKRGLSLLCVLALCLGLLPATALAAGDAPDTLYVGNQSVRNGDNTTYWVTNGSGGLESSDANANWDVKYDPATATLTLNGATITGNSEYASASKGAGIYALSRSGQPVSLTIELIGENTITGIYGIYVNSELSENSYGTDASLTITGESNGSLKVSGSYHGIYVKSGTGGASLNINDASVVAKTTYTYSGYAGVYVQSSAHATSSPQLSLKVNGGSLTANGGDSGTGIQFDVASSQANNATTSLIVSNNTIVRAQNGIKASRVDEPTPSGTGIVFDDKEGTVYGDVTLEEDLEIVEGETLTIPEGASLNANDNLTNNGTINVESGGNLNGGTTLTTPTISKQPTGQTVIEGNTAEFSLTASDAQTYQWQRKDTDTGSEWEDISNATTASYTTAATTTDMSGYQYRCVVTSASGVSVTSAAATLTVCEPTTYTITANADPSEGGTVTVNNGTSPVSVAAGNEVTLTATANSGYRFTGWTSSNGDTFADPSSASTTFTMPAGDVTVTANFEQYYTITVNASAGGTVDGGGDYTAGSSVTLNATANSGYRFVCWMENDQQVSADATYTFPASSNRTLTAKFEKVYNVTVNSTAGGTATADKTTAGVGETVSLTATPNNGYRFTGWTFSDNIIGADAFSKTTNITMPDGDVTATANFAKIPSVTPSTPPTVSEETTDAIKAADPGETVTVDLSSGSTTLDKEVFETLAGRDVTLVVDLGDGLSWTVNGSDISENADFTDIDMGVTMNSDGIPVEVVNAITGERDSVQLTLAHDGAFGFTMTLTAPLGAENAGYWANLYHFNEDANAMTFETAAPIGSDGSVSLSFNHASQYAIVIDDHNHGIVTLPFTDVREGDWFYDPVCYVYSQGLMTGTSATTFEPNTSLSRAMLVAVLHRLEGNPQASAGDFTDVAEGDWYAQAVNWAASVGVVNGFDDGTFQPNAAITREQMAAILRNYAQYKGLDVTTSGDLAHYSDAASVSDWAKESVEWVVDNGLIGGYEDSTLRPQGTTTRAEVASVLQRYLEK